MPLSETQRLELRAEFSESYLGQILGVSDVYGGERERKNMAWVAIKALGANDYAFMIKHLENDVDPKWLDELAAVLAEECIGCTQFKNDLAQIELCTCGKARDD